MTKKQSNVIKFTLCTLATVGLLWVFSIDDWSYFHVGVFAACVGVWLWYLKHVFTDNKTDNNE